MKRKRIPKWAVQHFDDFLNHIDRINKFLIITIAGVTRLPHLPNLFIALLDAEENEDIHSNSKQIEEAKQHAEFAKEEIENGFQLIYSQSLIGYWTSLEMLVKNFIVALLINNAKARSCQELKRIKIKFGEYEALDKIDRYNYIYDLLEESIGAKIKRGINRFEAVMKLFNLTSQVDSKTERYLFELYNIRNIFVHRRGIADTKIVNCCPRLRLKKNKHIIITSEMYKSYNKALQIYALELIQRVRVYFGMKRYEPKNK